MWISHAGVEVVCWVPGCCSHQQLPHPPIERHQSLTLCWEAERRGERRPGVCGMSLPPYFIKPKQVCPLMITNGWWMRSVACWPNQKTKKKVSLNRLCLISIIEVSDVWWVLLFCVHLSYFKQFPASCVTLLSFPRGTQEKIEMCERFLTERYWRERCAFSMGSKPACPSGPVAQ